MNKSCCQPKHDNYISFDIERVFETLGIENPMERYFPGVPEDVLNSIVTKTWIFTHGLAMFANSGIMKNLTGQEIQNLLVDIGAAVFLWETKSKDREAR